MNEERLFCSKPFRWLEVQRYPLRGTVYLCCPAWLPRPVGNLLVQSVQEAWNGPDAQALRASILDGSFRYCTHHCPFLHTRSGPVQRVEEIDDPELLDIIAEERVVLPHSPRWINAAFDRSCNLSCPSCRKEHVVEVDGEADIEALQGQLDGGGLADAEVLYITGSGDAFGSPYFRSWLQRLRPSAMPRLKTLHLHTNAQLWTSHLWEKIPREVRALVRSTEISIDAAEPATYALNRRGGSWDRLMENLAFIATLRAQGPLEYLKLHMVVQENNFDQMPAFVELGRQFGADRVYFSHLADWKTFSPDELQHRAIHRPEHPRHSELLDLLRDERLCQPQVDLGNLCGLLGQPRPRIPPRTEVGRFVESVL
jgi:hypothetical protein